MRKILFFITSLLFFQLQAIKTVSSKDPSSKLSTKPIFREGKEGGYHSLIWVDTKKYEKDIPVSKNENWEMISNEKWYFNCALFDPEKSEKPIKIYSFPASLVPTKDDFDKFKPRGLRFMPNGEFLSVENGVYKYNIFAEMDTNGRLWTSVDFGKRIPISFGQIDEAYQPWGDEEGNIYFKVIQSDDTSKFYMWDSSTETIKPQKELPTPTTPNYDIEETEDTITVKFDDKELEVSKTAESEIIDPLSIKEERLIGDFENYGTEKKPFTKQIYKVFQETGQIPIGIILAIRALLAREEEIVFDSDLELTETEIYELKRTINDMFETYEKKKRMLRELKKVFREYGPKGLLKKWLNETEYNAILIALNPEKGGAGVSKKFDHKGHTEIIEGHYIEVPLGYYRILKSKAQKGGFPRFQWSDYSEEKEQILIKTIQKYAKRYFMSKPNCEEYLLSTFKEFLKIPDQKNWVAWFEKHDENLGYGLEFELLFDYLVGLTKEQLTSLFDKAGISQIRRRKLMLILDVYKKSPLSPGVTS